MGHREEIPVETTGVVLFGSETGFGRPVLERLLDRGILINGVVTVGNQRKSTGFPVQLRQSRGFTILSEIALDHRIPMLQTQDLGESGFQSRLRALQAGIVLVSCFDHRIPEVIWLDMGIPCWNLHPSLLPRYRGPAPLYWQIHYGERATGLTLHQVTDEIDAGDIVSRKEITLPDKHDKASLDLWVATYGVEMFIEALEQFQAGKLVPVPQDESCASYYPWPGQDRDS